MFATTSVLTRGWPKKRHRSRAACGRSDSLGAISGGGLEPAPWTHPHADPNHRRFFTFPTRGEWTTELRAIRDDFAKYPGLGLPLPGNRRQKVFTIYAWNEFGEGGIVAPTRGDGSMKLEAIRAVFSSGE